MKFKFNIGSLVGLLITGTFLFMALQSVDPNPSGTKDLVFFAYGLLWIQFFPYLEVTMEDKKDEKTQEDNNEN